MDNMTFEQKVQEDIHKQPSAVQRWKKKKKNFSANDTVSEWRENETDGFIWNF